MNKNRSVALLIETSNAYGRGLLDGIIAYQREHELWSLHVGEQERGAEPPHWLRTWEGDGIIARIETDAIANVLRRLKIPVVDVSAGRRLPQFPWVETDDQKIAGLAAQHLLERGFKTLAYCGKPLFTWSNWREKVFLSLAKQANCDCHLFHAKHHVEQGYSWPRERRRLMTWLQGVPKPIGIMACYDFMGQQVLDACRELGLTVPEQVAVIGCDNDERLCQLCTPPLSSVVPDTLKAGYEAAELLNRLMNKKKVPLTGSLIPPLGIVQRQSSDVLAIEDAEIVAVLRLIRQNACKGLTLKQIMREVPLSRRVLEHRFQKLLGRTPHAEIIRIRIERASELLRETDLTLAEVAKLSGFIRADYLSVAFSRQVGISPSGYRRSTLLSKIRQHP